MKEPGSAFSGGSKALITKSFSLTYYPSNVPRLAKRCNLQVFTGEEMEAHKE